MIRQTVQIAIAVAAAAATVWAVCAYGLAAYDRHEAGPVPRAETKRDEPS